MKSQRSFSNLYFEGGKLPSGKKKNLGSIFLEQVANFTLSWKLQSDLSLINRDFAVALPKVCMNLWLWAYICAVWTSGKECSILINAASRRNTSTERNEQLQRSRIRKKNNFEGISGLNRLHLFTHLIYIHIKGIMWLYMRFIQLKGNVFQTRKPKSNLEITLPKKENT